MLSKKEMILEEKREEFLERVQDCKNELYKRKPTERVLLLIEELEHCAYVLGQIDKEISIENSKEE